MEYCEHAERRSERSCGLMNSVDRWRMETKAMLLHSSLSGSTCLLLTTEGASFRFIGTSGL